MGDCDGLALGTRNGDMLGGTKGEPLGELLGASEGLAG